MSSPGHMSNFPSGPNQQDAARFVQNKLPQLQPPQHIQNGASNNQLSNHRPNLMNTQETRQVEEYERQLKAKADACEIQLMEFIYRSKGVKNRRDSGKIPSPRATWEDVWQEVDNLKTIWDEKAKGRGGWIHKAGRNLGGHARAANHWLNMLPSGDYGAIVCGGLKFLLGAAIAEAEYTDLILEWLEKLPRLIEEASFTLDLYQDQVKCDPKQDFKLQFASLELSEEIMNMVKAVVAKFEVTKRKKPRVYISALLKQSEHTATLSDCIKRLEATAARLRQYAYQCLQKAAVETNKTVQNAATKEDVNNLGRKFEEVMRVFKDTNQFLMDNWYSSSWHNNMGGLAVSVFISRPVSPVQMTFAGPKEISEAMEVDEIALIKAVHGGLDSAYDDMQATSMVLQPLQYETSFLNWLRSNKSGIIILDHDADVSTSPFSFLAATLVESLRNVPRAIPIHYFCSDSDQEPGSYLLLRSLIFQLTTYTTNLAVATGELQAPDIPVSQQLSNLFKRCMEAIPAGTTIFIVIDGIGRHAFRNKEEAEFVVRLLLDELGRHYHADKRVKVLLTAPTTSDIQDIVGWGSIAQLHIEDWESGDADENFELNLGSFT